MRYTIYNVFYITYNIFFTIYNESYTHTIYIYMIIQYSHKFRNQNKASLIDIVIKKLFVFYKNISKIKLRFIQIKNVIGFESL